MVRVKTFAEYAGQDGLDSRINDFIKELDKNYYTVRDIKLSYAGVNEIKYSIVVMVIYEYTKQGGII